MPPQALRRRLRLRLQACESLWRSARFACMRRGIPTPASPQAPSSCLLMLNVQACLAGLAGGCSRTVRSPRVGCCLSAAAAGGALQGYAYVPPEDDEALMEAVYSRGTIAISLDASQPSFRFYASGANIT